MIKNHAHRRPIRGFTMVEAAISTLIVAVMFVAAVQAISASATIQFKAADRARGRTLSNALLGEILQQDYSASSANGTGGLVGIVVGGVLGGPAPATDRLGFNDIDDYSGYSESPPTHRDGTAIANASGYRRRVTIAKINPATFTVSAVETRAKLVTVEVTRNGLVVDKTSAVATDTP